jgi:hypothetical protein
MTNIMTPEKLKSVMNAITSPNYSHSNERVYGVIGIYHKDKSSSTGVSCAESLPSAYSFLLTMANKVHYQNIEFGMMPQIP